MALHVERIGDLEADSTRPRLVLAHGFTQNGRCWGRFGRLLARSAEVLAVDGPGHGRSGNDDADLWQSARLLTEAGGPGIYVGYSMGGRTALHAALTRPQLVRGLVLIGATAGIDDTADRARRREADEVLANRLTGDGLPAFLDRWLAGPLFRRLDAEAAAREQRLTNRVDGLAASLRHCGTGTQEPLWSRLGSLAMPVLVIAGQDDHKFTDLGRRMVAAMTGTEAELVTIPGTHAVHLEQPERTASVILDHIARWPPLPWP